MFTHEHPGSPERAAALLTLLAARVQAPDSAVWGPRVFRLLPYRGPFRLEAAVTRLASLPKPIVCALASMRAPALALWTDAELAGFGDGARAAFAADAEHAHRLAGTEPAESASEERTVGIVGREERVLLSVRDLAMWRDDYRMSLGSWRERRPSAEEAAWGARRVVELVSSEGDYLGTI